ncbi:hypothetical protein [Chroococcidiopsis sp. CCNUC1]|uniref:hypothetical protein n=1 Tax=Chroococcidiopsis sp. CCNUC1 TaxID=2653189 RepID=UPI002020EDE0|nr:hypothetical protein [Chroococcidiopsis sp. CCNUC1]URD48726.1 hypothetical protein M5J74_20610 [Chroococcidiopsis sp. CCNUC1]
MKEDTRRLQLEQKQLALAEEKKEKYWKNVRRWGRLLNTWIWIIAYTVVIFSLGATFGLNFLPNAILCRDKNSLCYILRLYGTKATLPPHRSEQR